MAKSKTQEFKFILEFSNFCLAVIPSQNHSERTGLMQNHLQQLSLYHDYGTVDWQHILAAFLENSGFQKNLCLYINVTNGKAAGR